MENLLILGITLLLLGSCLWLSSKATQYRFQTLSGLGIYAAAIGAVHRLILFTQLRPLVAMVEGIELFVGVFTLLLFTVYTVAWIKGMLENKRIQYGGFTALFCVCLGILWSPWFLSLLE